MNAKKEATTSFSIYFLKLELVFFAMSALAGLLTMVNYGWVPGLKMCLGIFLFLQPLFLYAYKDAFKAIWKEKRDQG